MTITLDEGQIEQEMAMWEEWLQATAQTEEGQALAGSLNDLANKTEAQLAAHARSILRPAVDNLRAWVKWTTPTEECDADAMYACLGADTDWSERQTCIAEANCSTKEATADWEAW